MEAIEEELQRLDSKILTDNDILKLYQFNQDTNDDINEKFRANEGPNSRFKANLSIPRISYLDPSLSRFLQLEVPVILSGSRLCRTAVGRWDIDYLERHMGSTAEFSVFSSPFPKFMYFDEAKNLGNFEFIPTTTKMTVTFSQFAKLVRQEKEGRNQCNHQQEEEKRTYYYLQQTLNQGVGDQIVEDFKGFDWDWVYGWQNRMGWGKLKFNTLWVGMEGVYTPTHYDEAHNFFGQVQGRKKFILFPPSQFPNLYVFPYHHPADRQSQVDIDYPDYTKFPLFREAQGLEGVVEAGDVLYLPPYWFHHVISLDETVSINFWFEMGQVDASRLTFPLNDSQKMAVRRNVEKMIGQVVGPSEVGKFLRELTVGRWDDLPQKKPTSKEGEKGEETSK
jgi:hypoxia-inducible factor 1-alpha inhibitor (HIF hydroxylase)